MRLAEDELKTLKKEAKRRGKTPSDLMRELLRREIACGGSALRKGKRNDRAKAVGQMSGPTP